MTQGYSSSINHILSNEDPTKEYFKGLPVDGFLSLDFF